MLFQQTVSYLKMFYQTVHIHQVNVITRLIGDVYMHHIEEESIVSTLSWAIPMATVPLLVLIAVIMCLLLASTCKGNGLNILFATVLLFIVNGFDVSLLI